MEVKVKPSLVITSSRRPSQLTNTFMKTLSAIFNAPVIRRGTSNLDHIALLAKEANVKGFLVVYTTKGNPSVIDLYGLTHSFFSLFGRIFILGLNINRHFRGNYKGNKLILKGESPGARKLFEFLKDYFTLTNQTVDNFNTNIEYNVIQIEDLAEITAKKLAKYEKDETFEPSVMVFSDERRGVQLLKMKIHHIWKSEQI